MTQLMRFIFDFTIILILSLCAYWMYVLVRSFFNKKNEKVKTKIVRIALITILFIVFITVFYGSFIEPQIIKVKNTTINLKKTAETEQIKIALVTDLHVGPYKQELFLERIVQIIKKEKPDFVILGGDYLYNNEKNARYLTPLKDLSLEFPLFAVTGNHEFGTAKYGDKDFIDKTTILRQLFNEWNIPILDNAVLPININGHDIDIYGIEDLWTKRADLASLIHFIDPQKTNILISHNPDIILDANHAPFNLILSGHTHAGQIRLPYFGAISNIPTVLGRKFDHGLFSFDANYIYISAGLGESGVRARLFNPPELAIINLDL